MNQQLRCRLPTRPRNRAIHARAARLAQRLLRGPRLARQRRRTPLTPEQKRRADARAPATASRRRRRRSALARSDDGDGRAHEARRRPPLRRRMMAAMAQQDCGQCGYSCEDYSNAIFDEEGRAPQPLRPGRQGNRRDAQGAVEGARRHAVRGRAVVPAATAGRGNRTKSRSRDNPVTATFLSRTRLNRAEFREGDLAPRASILPNAGSTYVVGDSFGVFPANDPALVDAIIAALDAPAGSPVAGRTLRDVLDRRSSRSRRARRPVPALFLCHRRRAAQKRARSRRRRPRRRRGDARCARGAEKFPGIRPIREAFIEALDPLQPRVYSISSSSKAHPGTDFAHGRHRALRHCGRTRLGVASTFFGAASIPAHRRQGVSCRRRTTSRCPPTSKSDRHDRTRHRRRAVPRLPARADGHQGPGRNWLFFGHQRAAATSSTRTN